MTKEPEFRGARKKVLLFIIACQIKYPAKEQIHK